jgi:dUTPase
MWERQEILPGEQYYESQLAAAKHFGVDQSTVSRQLSVLIESDAIIVLKPSERGADGFWTSKVVTVTNPPANPHTKMHTDEAVENTGVSSRCKNASPTTLHSSCTSTKNTPITDYKSSTTVDDDYVSDAKMHVDEVTANKASRPLAQMHVDRAALADQIVAAKKSLADLEQHVAEHGEDGWGEILRHKRAGIHELEQEYAAIGKKS